MLAPFFMSISVGLFWRLSEQLGEDVGRAERAEC